MSFMDENFNDAERLYRAVYPPSHPGLYWKKDNCREVEVKVKYKPSESNEYHTEI